MKFDFKKILNNRIRYVLIGILTLVILILTIFVFFKYLPNYFKNNSHTNNVFENELYENEKEEKMYRITAIEPNFSSRANVKKAKTFYVGNSEAEIENGYYDIKITNTKMGVKIFVNKLWKTEPKNSLYDEGYVIELSGYIQDICFETTSVEFDDEDMELIYEYILENYELAKSGEEFINGLFIKTINIEFECENFELIIEVRA